MQVNFQVFNASSMLRYHSNGISRSSFETAQFRIRRIFVDQQHSYEIFLCAMENNNKEAPELAAQDSSIKKRYCDKQFKKNISKAIKVNHGEPDNIDKICA